jgi:accessory gene regulator protein AgrB
MKAIIIASVTIIGLTMCQYAPAQTTQIITPDGRLITCIGSGSLITCY